MRYAAKQEGRTVRQRYLQAVNPAHHIRDHEDIEGNRSTIRKGGSCQVEKSFHAGQQPPVRWRQHACWLKGKNSQPPPAVKGSRSLDIICCSCSFHPRRAPTDDKIQIEPRLNVRANFEGARIITGRNRKNASARNNRPLPSIAAKYTNWVVLGRDMLQGGHTDSST